MKKLIPLIILVAFMGTLSGFLVVEVSAECGEVEFRGIVNTEEEWNDVVCYGSYRCFVTVDEILYDPNSTLTLGANVSVAYSTQMYLEVGERVECRGYYWKDCACPMQYYGHCECKDEGHYVMRYECGEVKFRGMVTSDETTAFPICYLSPYCNVSVQKIIYDPEGLLTIGVIVSVCYNASLSLKVGEQVECYGYYWKNCAAPMQYFGHVVCIDEGYYVKRYPPVGGIMVPIDKLGLLAPYIGLASTILIGTVAAAVYTKRIKRKKEN